METNLAVRGLAALAQETRLSVFRLLVQAGPDGLPAGKIAESVGVPLPTLSFHLKELVNAGLVTSRSVSRFVIYRADYGRIGELVGFLNENCCRGMALTGSAPAEACGPGSCAPNLERTPS